jgi:lipoprotein NlpD
MSKYILRSVILVLVLGLAVGLLSAETATHTLARGETIYSVAREYGVPQALIIAANDISDPRNVPVGTVLRIPGTYEVQRGDSYYGIARKFEVELSELLEANDRSADSVLRVGEVLVLPAGARSGDNSENANANGDISDSRDMLIDSGSDSLEWPITGDRAPVSGKLPGVLISGTVGDEVRSIASGRVRYTGPYSGFGRVVIVQSPEGYVYVYGGTESIVVNVGDLVVSGSLLGLLGRGTYSDNPTLYFSVWKGNVPVRPENAPRG